LERNGKGETGALRRDATLTGVRKMISDLEGPSDPNPFILAIRAAFDVKRKGLYATSPTA